MSVIKRNKTNIVGLPEDLQSLTAQIGQEATDRAQAVAAALQAVADEVALRDNAITTAVSSEATRADQAIADAIDQVSVDYQDSIDGAVAGLLQISQNLADLGDVAAARGNLGVYSTAEVVQLVNTAKLALGTNHSVATIAERDALPNLDLADTVTVTNGGNWSKYGVQSVSPLTFFVLTTKAEYDAANSAAAVKAALLSNSDTHVLTDAEKGKLDGIDTSDLVLKSGLNTSATLAGASDTQAASALALKTFIADSVRTGGQVNVTESLLVTNDRIVLTNKPKDGMIYNFATVRNTTAGLSYDIPVAADGADATGKTYILSPDAAGEFDAKLVVVQYPTISAA